MTIVVGYSPSDQGRAALDAAVRYSASRGEDLVVAAHQYLDSGRGVTTATEEEVLESLRGTGADLDRVTVLTGAQQDVGEFILAVTEEAEASLVVIGLRHKTPIGKLNLGASARRVVLGAPCPVLAVKDGDRRSGGRGRTRR